MDDEMLYNARNKLAAEAQALATPIDFDHLMEDGLIKKIGNSYYTDNIHGLPEIVTKKIQSFKQTRNGLKLTFYKETKAL